jgi:hypothetical protein
LYFLLDSFRRAYIFLKESVKRYYTKSYKILVAQDSYRVVSDFFWIFLESHVVLRAQRAGRDSSEISRHLVTFREGAYILLKKREKGIILNLIRFLLHKILIELYQISFGFSWNLM